MSEKQTIPFAEVINRNVTFVIDFRILETRKLRRNTVSVAIIEEKHIDFCLMY